MKLAAIAGALPVVAALLLGSACSSQMQRSAPFNESYLKSDLRGKPGITGMPYFLPDTVVPLTVSGDFVLMPERASKKEKISAIDFEYVVTVTVGVAKQVADPDAALMIEYLPEAGTNDTFKLTVGTNGLLNTVKSTSEDQSAAIIVKLAELAKEGLRTVTALGGLGIKSIQRDQEDVTEDDVRRLACAKVLRKMSVTTEVNLSDALRFSSPDDPAATQQQAAYLNEKVVTAMQGSPPSSRQRLVRNISLGTSKRGAMPNTQIAQAPPPNPNAQAYSGVVFRLMTPRTFGLDVSTADVKFGTEDCTLRSGSFSADGGTIMVADPLRTFVVDNSRTAFVKKTVNLTVTDGVLTTIDVEKPSELLAAISLPVDVLKVIASIPAELLSIKVKQISDEKSLSSAQVEMLKLQIELIKQRQALIDAQTGTAK